MDRNFTHPDPSSRLTRQVMVRFDEKAFEALVAEAQRTQRSLSFVARELVEVGLKRQKKEKAA
jgi:predicted HicB family RNase H-like nuclease